MGRWQERRLLRRLRKGDREAAERLIAEHYLGVYRWLLCLCGDSEEAADLTQETFLQVWRGIGDFEGRSALKTWLHRIAYHAFLRGRESRPVAGVPLAEMADDPGPAADVLRRRAVADALARLPDKHHQAVLLHYMQGLTAAEIGNVLGIPTSTILSRLQTARQKLRVFLAAEGCTPEQGVRADAGRK